MSTSVSRRRPRPRRSRPAIRSRLASREPVAATWPETSTSRASNMPAIVSAGADIVCGRMADASLALRASRVWRPDWPCPVAVNLVQLRRRVAATRRTAAAPTAPSGAASARPWAPRRCCIRADAADGTVTGEAWGSGADWALDAAAPDARRRRRPDGVRAAAAAHAEAWRRHRHWRVGATDLVMESLVPAIIEQKVTGMEALGRLPGAGAPVRRAGPGPAERARAGRAALGAALARGAAGDPVLGVAAAAGRRSPVAPDPARGPGRVLAGAGRPGDARRSSTAGCARCPASASGRARRCASGRWATPTRSASATTTSPPTWATC